LVSPKSSTDLIFVLILLEIGSLSDLFWANGYMLRIDRFSDRRSMSRRLYIRLWKNSVSGRPLEVSVLRPLDGWKLMLETDRFSFLTASKLSSEDDLLIELSSSLWSSYFSWAFIKPLLTSPYRKAFILIELKFLSLDSCLFVW
jgi:hypothetical protein